MASKPYPTCTPLPLGALVKLARRIAFTKEARARYLSAKLRGVADRIWSLTRHAFAQLYDALKRRRRKLRARAGELAMMALDDRLLRDIGLKRSEIHAAAYGLLRRDPVSRDPHDGSNKL